MDPRLKMNAVTTQWENKHARNDDMQSELHDGHYHITAEGLANICIIEAVTAS